MTEPGRIERVDIRRAGGYRRARVEEAIVAAGRFQHRQVTRAQLRAAGLGDDAIDHRVRDRRLHAVFAEVFSLGGPPQTDKELWMAATLSFGGRLAASSAANLYGWLRYPLPGLYVATATRRKPRDGIIPLHRPRQGRSKYIDFVPVTGPEQTVLDCAMTVRADKAYRRIVRQAQVDDTSHALLSAFVAMRPGHRGVGRLRRELADGPARTRSANEDEVLAIFRSGETPLTNHRFAADLEADLYFPALGVIIEVDSAIHDSPTAQADDERKDARYRALGLKPYRLR